MKVTPQTLTRWIETWIAPSLWVCSGCYELTSVNSPICQCERPLVQNETTRVFLLESWDDLPAQTQVEMDRYMESAPGNRFSQWLSYGFTGRDFHEPSYWMRGVSYDVRIQKFWEYFGYVWSLRNTQIVKASYRWRLDEGKPAVQLVANIGIRDHEWVSEYKVFNRLFPTFWTAAELGKRLPQYVEVQIMGIPFLVDLACLKDKFHLYDDVLYINEPESSKILSIE